MKPADVKSSICFDFDVKNNDRNPNFKVGDQVRTSKYKNIFIKGQKQNRSEEVFLLKKLKMLYHGLIRP